MNTTQGFSVRQEKQLSSTRWLHCGFPCSPFGLAEASLLLTHSFMSLRPAVQSRAESWSHNHIVSSFSGIPLFLRRRIVFCETGTARRDVIVRRYSQSWVPYAVCVTWVWTHSETSINHPPDGKQTNTSTPNSTLLDSNFHQVVPSSNSSGASAIATLHVQILLSVSIHSTSWALTGLNKNEAVTIVLSCESELHLSLEVCSTQGTCKAHPVLTVSSVSESII